METTTNKTHLESEFLSLFHPEPSSEGKIETSYCYFHKVPNMSVHCSSVKDAFRSWEAHGRDGNFYFGATSKKREARGRSKKGDALRAYAIPIEIDSDKSEEESGPDLIESTKSDLLEHTKDLPLELSGLLDSGGGLLGAYRLSEPLEDLARWEAISDRIAYWYNQWFGPFIKKKALGSENIEDNDCYGADRSIAKRNTLLRFLDATLKNGATQR